MAGIGRFRNDTARETYLRAYDAMEPLWPLPSTTVEVGTTFGTTMVRRSGGGRGLPLVLLHGLNGTGLSWYAAAADLARDREIVAVDVLGTAGRSVQAARFERDDDLGTWYGEVLAGLGLERPHLLGESNGAWHATLAALHSPTRPASLTLVEPNGFVVRPATRALLKFVALSSRPTEAGWRKMSAWLTPGIAPRPEEAALAKAAMAFRPGLGWARVLRDDELARVDVPTLAVFGGDSVLSEPDRAVSRLHEHLPDVETVVVPGGGHAVHAQLPNSVRPRILDFLRRHEAVTAPDAPG